MDVTRDNFANALAQFRAAVVECDFAAMDMEMTGLYESREHQPNSHTDTRDERYAKLKRSVESYAVVQVGICLFTWVADGDSDGGYYEARPFTFNVFPSSSAAGVPVDVHFGCKSSALEFLTRCSFDFNKWVYQGVRYLRTEDADRIRRERAAVLGGRERRPVDAGERGGAFVRELEKEVAAFLASGRSTMQCEAATSYQRKLIYDVVSRHDSLGAQGRSGFIEVFKGSRKMLASHRAQRLKALDRSLNEARGFSAVIDALSAARKPVAGHNMLLDVLHAYDKFWRALPATRAEFERALPAFLPTLVDTKHIIESTPAFKAKYGTSSLDEIAPLLEPASAADAVAAAAAAAAPAPAPGQPHPRVRFHPRFTRNVSRTMHEAGYDAYITGVLLIRLLSLDGALAASDSRGGELVLFRYINRLHMATTEGAYWGLHIQAEHHQTERQADNQTQADGTTDDADVDDSQMMTMAAEIGDLA